MTDKEVGKVKLGDTMRWLSDGTLGRVVEVGYNGFKVQWVDNQIGVYFRGPGSDLEYLQKTDHIIMPA